MRQDLALEEVEALRALVSTIGTSLGVEVEVGVEAPLQLSHLLDNIKLKVGVEEAELPDPLLKSLSSKVRALSFATKLLSEVLTFRSRIDASPLFLVSVLLQRLLRR